MTPVITSEFNDYIRIIGEVEALHDVTVAGEESGVIKQFFVDKGAPVRKNQPIVKLKDDVLAAQVEEAMAVASLAQEQFKRQRELWRAMRVTSRCGGQWPTPRTCPWNTAKLESVIARARLSLIPSRPDAQDPHQLQPA